MKNLLLLLLPVLFFASCKSSDEQLAGRIAHADSVAINYFTGDGKMDSVVAVKIVKDQKIIQQLADDIPAVRISQKAMCGYDGSVHFFKGGIVVQDIDFRMNDELCMQFSYMLNGEHRATKLSSEIKKVLAGLRN